MVHTVRCHQLGYGDVFRLQSLQTPQSQLVLADTEQQQVFLKFVVVMADRKFDLRTAFQVGAVFATDRSIAQCHFIVHRGVTFSGQCSELVGVPQRGDPGTEIFHADNDQKANRDYRSAQAFDRFNQTAEH